MMQKGQVNVSRILPLEDIASHPTYLSILKQILLGNKTSTGIANKLNKNQGGIYYLLKSLENLSIVKRDNKNWEINFEALPIVAIAPLGYSGVLENIKDKDWETFQELFKYFILKSLPGENFYGIIAQIKLVMFDLKKDKKLRELAKL